MKTKHLLPAALLLALPSCWGLSPDIPRALRAYDHAIVSEYQVYVAEDHDLSLEEKQRRIRTVETFRLFVTALEAEAGLDPEAQQ